MYELKSPRNVELNHGSKIDENELRETLVSCIQNDEYADVWAEKILKDPIEDVVEMMNSFGFMIKKIK